MKMFATFDKAKPKIGNIRGLTYTLLLKQKQSVIKCGQLCTRP